MLYGDPSFRWPALTPADTQEPNESARSLALVPAAQLLTGCVSSASREALGAGFLLLQVQQHVPSLRPRPRTIQSAPRRPPSTTSLPGESGGVAADFLALILCGTDCEP